MQFGINTPPQHCTWQELLDVWQAANQLLCSMRNPYRPAALEPLARALEPLA